MATLKSISDSWFSRSLVVGFATALVVWITWFLTHLPWLDVPERVSMPLVLGAWMVFAIAGCVWAGRDKAVQTGALAGLITAILGLLILGSKLAKPSTADGVSPGTIPSAVWIALGFLGLGAVIGLIAGGVAQAVGKPATERHWLARFAIVAVVAVAPLLFIGGLVTSTNSGMAVPDWPNTYGSNMFLYPLGPRVEAAMGKSYEQVFFEHSHRLFGTLVGCTVLTLAIWVFRRESRRWVIGVAAAAFVLVVLQGVLGGIRVNQGSLDAAADLKAGRWYSMGHGILAQLCFGVLVALAVYLAPLYRTLAASDVESDPKNLRRARILCTALLHTLILQLIFGAMYRHLRSDHALWSHIGFSFIVTLVAMGAGVMLTSLGGRVAPTLGRLGWGLLGVVIFQFVLGWIAFLIGSKGHAAANVAEALVRTTHQANGALLLALATASFVWARHVSRVGGGSAKGGVPQTAAS